MGRIILVRADTIRVYQSFALDHSVQSYWRHYYDWSTGWAYVSAPYDERYDYNGKELILSEYHKSQYTVYTDLYNEKGYLQRVLRERFKIESSK